MKRAGSLHGCSKGNEKYRALLMYSLLLSCVYRAKEERTRNYRDRLSKLLMNRKNFFLLFEYFLF